ncbi:MAG TPA: pilus assembly protein TadG-related protein [Caulobacteraceae bacterium]|nr:pilus assembly protein TadG-related protein [Caulobacteraceae bacterium]
MTRSHGLRSRLGARLAQAFRNYCGGRAGNVAPIIALMVVPMVGAIGMATEVSNWFLTNRSAQNAADSAVIAAATAAANNSSSDYSAEGQTVATQYGFTNGANAATVSVVGGVTCPDGTTSCYQATVTKTLPLYMTAIVGYKGTTTLNGNPATLVKASAIAEIKNETTPDCIVALDPKKNAIALHTNGAPKSDLAGCVAQTNSSANCNGHNLGLAAIIGPGAAGSGCGNEQFTGPAIADPYASLANNIPATPAACSNAATLPQESAGTQDKVSGTNPWSGPGPICGDQQLTGNVTLTSNQTIIIYNGMLDLNGYTLTTASGVGVTFVFSGTNTVGSVTPYHIFTDNSSAGKGVLDVSSPTSGTWSGVAIYQDPNLADTKIGKNYSLDITQAGSAPTLDLSGLVYLPNSNVTVSGAIDQASNGFSCFTMVVYTVLINGNGSIFKNPQTGCGSQGLNQATSTIPYAFLVS